MAEEEDESDVVKPKLSFDPDEKFPCLANTVDIRNMVEPCYYGDVSFDRYVQRLLQGKGKHHSM